MMISKEQARNFVNKGYIVTQSMIEKVLFVNVFFTIFNTTFFIIEKKYIYLVIYLLIFILYGILTAIFSSIRFFTFKNSFLNYSAGYLVFVLIINTTIYNLGNYMDMFSPTLFLILFIVQILHLILAILLNFKIFINYFGRKNTRAIPYVSGWAGGISYLILQIFFDGSQKKLMLIINLVCYSCFFLVLYDVSKYFCKWCLVRKFNIKDYNEIEN